MAPRNFHAGGAADDNREEAMNVRELIDALLCEIGESDLARKVATKLAKNEEGGLDVFVPTEGGSTRIREVIAHFDRVCMELE